MFFLSIQEIKLFELEKKKDDASTDTLTASFFEEDI